MWKTKRKIELGVREESLSNNMFTAETVFSEREGKNEWNSLFFLKSKTLVNLSQNPKTFCHERMWPKNIPVLNAKVMLILL